MNLAIRAFRNKLINSINEENLPIEVKRLVVREILDQINETSENEIQFEIKKLEENKEEKENGSTESTPKH